VISLVNETPEGKEIGLWYQNTMPNETCEESPRRGGRCDLSDQDVLFKKTSDNLNYGSENSIDSPLQWTVLSLRTSVPLVGSSSFADRKAFCVKFF